MKKTSYMLKDPNFVPKNKKIRFFIFIVVNLVLVALLPITAILINFPYGYICWIPIFCINALFNIKGFHVHTERYPLNNYDEYKFNPLVDMHNEGATTFVIKVKKSKNVYTVELKDKSLVFDMKGCFCPLTVIKAYLIRQFIMLHINKCRLSASTMGKNVNISNHFSVYKNVMLRYKGKDHYLIEKHKTKMNCFMKSINGYRYVPWYVTYRKIDDTFIKMDEKSFVSIKEEYNK